MRQERLIRHLPVALTPEEFDVKAAEMAQAEIELGDLTVAKSTAASDFKAKIDTVKGRLAVLAGVVDKRSEVREVECEESMNLDRKIVEIVRIDTGEIVDTRGITGADIQQALPHMRVDGEGASAEGD